VDSIRPRFLEQKHFSAILLAKNCGSYLLLIPRKETPPFLAFNSQIDVKKCGTLAIGDSGGQGMYPDKKRAVHQEQPLCTHAT
jgi:hypothetical protein